MAVPGAGPEVDALQIACLGCGAADRTGEVVQCRVTGRCYLRVTISEDVAQPASWAPGERAGHYRLGSGGICQRRSVWRRRARLCRPQEQGADGDRTGTSGK